MDGSFCDLHLFLFSLPPVSLPHSKVHGMTSPKSPGGVIHTYQRYDPMNIPGPSGPPPDLVSPAFQHMLEFGDMRELTEEELARAIKLDIRQIAGLGPSLESLRRMLLERKQKILATWETKTVVVEARRSFTKLAHNTHPPDELKSAFQKAVDDEQIRRGAADCGRSCVGPQAPPGT